MSKPQQKIINQGEFGEPLVHNFPRGVWPDDMSKSTESEQDKITAWAIARCGTIHGYFGDVLWYEKIEDSQGNKTLLPVQAYGIWNICDPCNSSIGECEELGCRESGCCKKKEIK